MITIKRQAEIIAKQTGIKHRAALEVAAKCNGFKNWHEAEKVGKPKGSVEEEIRSPEIETAKYLVDGLLNAFEPLKELHDEKKLPKQCFWVDPDQHKTWNKKYKEFIPSVVKADKLGHYPMGYDEADKFKEPWLWGETYEEAFVICDETNEKQGVSKEQAMGLVLASMRDKDQDVSKLMEIGNAHTSLVGPNKYEVKVKTLAEIKRYFTVEAGSAKEAVLKTRDILDIEYGAQPDSDEWEVCYVEDGLTKITDCQNIGGVEGDWLADEAEGLEDKKVHWPL